MPDWDLGRLRLLGKANRVDAPQKSELHYFYLNSMAATRLRKTFLNNDDDDIPKYLDEEGYYSRNCRVSIRTDIST